MGTAGDHGASRAATAAGLAILAPLLAIGVFALREETMTRHEPVPEDSRLAVVIDASTKLAEQDVREMAWAKVLMCRTEVRNSDPVTRLEELPGASEGEQRYRFVLQPTLDEADRTQFRGCLRDWNLDHLRIEVLRYEELAPAARSEPS